MNSIIFLKAPSIAEIIRAIIIDATITIIELPCNSFHVGQVTFSTNSLYASPKYDNIFIYNYFARVERLELPTYGFGDRHSTNWATPVNYRWLLHHLLNIYFIISITWPAPTVRPPSRIAKVNPLSIATGVINSTVIVTLSPGITISTPSGNWISPVTSNVRK